LYGKLLVRAQATSPCRVYKKQQLPKIISGSVAKNFTEFAIPSPEWKLQLRKKNLPEYVTTKLEAFAIVVYYNSFDVWNQ
jgi:hypothetical protein